MANASLEKMLLEAVKHIINQDNLGITGEGAPAESEHHTQFQMEDINASFAIKMKDSDFFDSLTSTFFKVHSSHWICDSSFITQFTAELKAQGIPVEEIGKGTKAIEQLAKEYTDGGKKNENAVGFPNMKDMKKVSQEFGNGKTSEGETFKGNNKPPLGVHPDDARPVPTKA